MEVSLYSENTSLELNKCLSTDSPQPELAPAFSSSRALARFEFEACRGNEGSKILMIEWLDEIGDSDWQISWESTKIVMPAKDAAADKLLRIYFLLGPGANVPRIVKISRLGANSQHMQTNPLPAIFPPELGATAQVRKGVLHTLWAKKRLSALQKEIELEMKNGEGIGLEMALQEKKWIEENFGVVSKVIPELRYSMAPSSSQNGRLPQRLKSLSLATGSWQLNAPISLENSSMLNESTLNPLSLDSNNVAISSYPLFKSPSHQPSIAQPRPDTQPITQNTLFMRSKSPNRSSFHSIDAIAIEKSPKKEEIETEDELFALKLSPRSPEMARSPFCGNQ